MRTKRKLSFIMVLTAVTLISILCYAAFMKPDRRIQRFQEEFGLTLPAETKVIFAERDYGAMGDGFCFYIYQLPPQEMSLLLQEKSLSRWRPLPLDSSLTVLINERVNAFTSSDMVKEIDFNIQNGYYIFRNTGNPPAIQWIRRILTQSLESSICKTTQYTMERGICSSKIKE